jgi:hypothetical protein
MEVVLAILLFLGGLVLGASTSAPTDPATTVGPAAQAIQPLARVCRLGAESLVQRDLTRPHVEPTAARADPQSSGER